MTPDAFRYALETLGWSWVFLAEKLDCNERTVRRWANGTREVPEPIAMWLADLALYHNDRPPPEWRRE